MFTRVYSTEELMHREGKDNQLESKRDNKKQPVGDRHRVFAITFISGLYPKQKPALADALGWQLADCSAIVLPDLMR